jgi:type IV pilus assembly protein PilC
MESTQFFDKKMIALTRVGEEVNKLDSVYQQLLKQYSEDLETRVKAMNSLLEPVMIILVGCIVAIILVSMYLPIFKLGTGVF